MGVWFGKACRTPTLHATTHHRPQALPARALKLELCDSPAAMCHHGAGAGEALVGVLGAGKDIYVKCTERLQRRYLLFHAMVMQIWYKPWAAWKFRSAGCPQLKSP